MSVVKPQGLLSVTPQGRWCVYTHASDGIVFYVGFGRPLRPFNRHHRSRQWFEFVESAGTYMIDIVLWTDDKIQALQTEREIIEQFAPVCNGPFGPPRRTAKRKAKSGRFVSHRIPWEMDTAIVSLAAEKEITINEMYIQLLTAGLAQNNKRLPARPMTQEAYQA